MKTPLPKFPHHRGVPEHHFGVKTPLLATLQQVQTQSNISRNGRAEEEGNYVLTLGKRKI